MKKALGFLLVMFLLMGVFVTPGVLAQREGEYGGTLIRDAAYGDPENLDPIVRGRISAMMVTMNLFDGLVAHDPESAAVIPAIAERWTISDDGLVYTFYLRNDAYFHNGRNITAHDFIYSFERLVDPVNASPLSFYLEGVIGKEAFEEGTADNIEGLKVLEDYVLEITLEGPNTSFLVPLGFPAAGVVPKEDVDRLGRDFGHQPVGSGPFKFVSWTKDDRVVLEIFEDYYKGRAYLDGLVFRVIPEAASKEADFRAGNLDAFIAPASIYRRVRNDPAFTDKITTVAEFFTRHIGFHTQKEPFNDVRVRQAFNYAIDTEAIIDIVLGGKGIPAVGFLPSSSYAFNKEMEGYGYDPDKARELLAAAGYADGVEVPIMTNEHPEWGLPVVEGIMGYLSDVGITLKPEVMETGVLYDRIRNGNYVSYIYSTGGDPHPVDYLYRFHTSRQEDINRYSNPELDALLEEAKRTADDQKVVQMVHEIDQMILEAAPIYFFHYNMAVMMHQDYVYGIKSAPIDMAMQDMWDVWMDPAPTR